MPTLKHQQTIVGYQALIGHLSRQRDKKNHINALRSFIADIRKCKSIPLDLQGNPVRPMQHVCMKGKSYTILSVHFLGDNVWAAMLEEHSKRKPVIVRTSNEVVGW